MNIRKATKNDFDSLLKLHLQLEDAEIAFDSNLVKHFYDTNRGRKRLKKHLKNKNNIILVMVENDKVIGFIDGDVDQNSWWYKEAVAFINYLCVDKKYRKKGIAGQLLDAFEKQLREKKIKFVRLLAFPHNVPAVNFYKKNQFNEYSIYYNKILK